MKPTQASRTAKVIAAATLLLASDPRTAGWVVPGAADRCQRCLAGSLADRCLAWSVTHPLWRPLWRGLERLTHPGIMVHYWRRKHWIEQHCRSAIHEGFGRVIILGAGFDTLAARLSSEFPQVEWIEVDHPATQRVKRRAMGRGDQTMDGVQWLPLDLSRHSLAAVLPKDDRSTLIIIEGVLMYLPPNEVDHLLATLQQLPADRLRVAFSFMARWPDGSIGFRPQSMLVRRWMAWCQEPFLWAMEPAAMRVFLAVRRFALRELALGHELADALPTSAPKLAGENLVCCERMG